MFKTEGEATHEALVEGFMAMVDLLEDMGIVKDYEGVYS